MTNRGVPGARPAAGRPVPQVRRARSRGRDARCGSRSAPGPSTGPRTGRDRRRRTPRDRRCPRRRRSRRRRPRLGLDGSSSAVTTTRSVAMSAGEPTATTAPPAWTGQSSAQPAQPVAAGDFDHDDVAHQPCQRPAPRSEPGVVDHRRTQVQTQDPDPLGAVEHRHPQQPTAYGVGAVDHLSELERPPGEGALDVDALVAARPDHHQRPLGEVHQQNLGGQDRAARPPRRPSRPAGPLWRGATGQPRRRRRRPTPPRPRSAPTRRPRPGQ